MFADLVKLRKLVFLSMILWSSCVLRPRAQAGTHESGSSPKTPETVWVYKWI